MRSTPLKRMIREMAMGSASPLASTMMASSSSLGSASLASASSSPPSSGRQQMHPPVIDAGSSMPGHQRGVDVQLTEVVDDNTIRAPGARRT